MLYYCRKCRSSNIHWFISVLKVCRERYKRWVHIIIKLGYNTRCHCLKELLYDSIEHRPELKLSRHLPYCTMSDLLRDYSLAFSDNWKWNFGTSEPESSNRRTKQRFINILGVVIYVIETWAETKILKEKTKMDSPSFKGAQSDCNPEFANTF